jgi:hypothetical protein
VSETTVAETQRQYAGVKVIQSFNARMTTIGMEMVIVPNINVVKRGVLIGSTTKLGSGLGRILTRRNLSQNLMLPIVTIGVVAIPQMVFTNSIMATHGNMTVDQPLINSMATKRCKNVDAMHSKGNIQKEDIENQLL